MFKKKRLTVLSLAVLLALLVAATMPLAALAQDEAPPQTEVPAVVEDEPVVDEPAEELTVPEVLDQLPAETDLVVLDQNGEALPLASTEAAEVIIAPDPKFCPGTASFDDLLCGPVRATISEAVADAYAAGGSGTIYVEAGTFNENVVIDGSSFKDGIAPTNFTVWGAGSGVGGTTLNGSFTISNMNAFTLSGFSINTSSGFNNSIDISNGNGTLQLNDLDVTNANEESNGIRVDSQTGNVNLTDVKSTTQGTGIYISVLGGDVTLDDVATTGNSFDGASIRTDNGNVTINNGNFSSNGYGGGYIDAGSGNITVNGGGFSGNGDTGLYLRTGGSSNVRLNNVTATGNGVDGVYVTGGALPLRASIASALVVSSSDVHVNVLCGNYSGNGGYGLNMQLPGGSAYLGGSVFNANGLGGYNLVGGTVSFGECPKPIDKPIDKPVEESGGKQDFKPENDISPLIPVTGQVCDGEKKVVLKAGDAFGIYQNLCDFDFQLKEVTENDLPGVLPSGVTQLGGLDAQVTSGGIVQSELPAGGKIIIKFPIPDDADKTNLAVLFWNGAEWIEVPGGQVIDGFYVVEVTKPGIYVQVSQ